MKNIDFVISTAFGLDNVDDYLPEYGPDLDVLLAQIGQMGEERRDYFSIAVDDDGVIDSAFL